MANIKSAKKRARQTIVRRARNKSALSSVRTSEKKLRTAIQGKNASGAKEALQAFASRISKAASKGIITAKSASRKVSRLSKQVSQLG